MLFSFRDGRESSRVHKGRRVMDEPTDLPEGYVVELLVLIPDHRDGLDDASREKLHAALGRARQAIEEDRLVDGEQVLSRLRS